jgi:hypothetical protein
MKHNYTTTNKNNKTFKDKMYEVPKGRILSKAQKAVLVGSLAIASLVGYEANNAVHSVKREIAAASAENLKQPDFVVEKSIDNLQKGGSVKYMQGEFAFTAKLFPSSTVESFVVENPAVVEVDGKYIPYFVPAGKEITIGEQDLMSDNGQNLVSSGMVAFSQPLIISKSEFTDLPDARLNDSGNLVAEVNGQTINVGFNKF